MKISSNKVGISGTAGALAIIIVYAIEQFGIKIPVEVAQAISTLVSSIFGIFIVEESKK